jgi:drug/metabolite transporter (DMT)-like permease
VSAVALILVVAAAIMHAGWNTLAKRSGDGLTFMWAFTLASLVIYAIPVAVFLRNETPDRDALPFVLGSGVLHVAYFRLLARSYAGSDLSLAYPVARGTGVLLAPVLAMPIYGDRPTFAAWIGIAAILGGIVWLYAPAFRRSISRGGVGGLLMGPPLLTGVVIACYSLVDAGGVRRLHPVVYLYAVFAVSTALLAPTILARRPALNAVSQNWRPVVLAGAAAFGTYVVVLSALRLAPVSYVIPIREISIVFAALFGARTLGERLGPARAGACILVTAGVILIAIGG